jgi:hypothetical protein
MASREMRNLERAFERKLSQTPHSSRRGKLNCHGESEIIFGFLIEADENFIRFLLL